MNQWKKTVLIFLRIMTLVCAVGGPSRGGPVEFAQAAESADVSVSMSVIGAFPHVQGMNLAGRAVSETSAHNAVGGGLKVGIFPEFTHRALGVELEYFGTTGRLSVMSGSAAEGKAGLTVLNSMINIVIKQPTGNIRPYGGAGMGYSGGILHGAGFPGRANRDFDSTAGFACQFIGGLQWDFSTSLFLFVEYKRLMTTFHWKAASLDYRADYVLSGIGWTF